MIHSHKATSSLLRANWFVFAAAGISICDLVGKALAGAAPPKLIEAALVFDLCLLIPLMYWLCYRNKGKRTTLRAAGIACLGIWIAAKVLPASEQNLVQTLWPLRYLGMAVLAIIELKVAAQVYKLVFSGGSAREAAAALESQAGMPAWLARIVSLEAVFWRKVLGLLHRNRKR